MTVQKLLELLDANFELMSGADDDNLMPALKMLGMHLENPRSYVMLAGETSSGKSTLVNSFLGRKFLPAGAKPTTGAVTWMEYGLVEKERFLAINRDATYEEITYEQFRSLSEKPDKNLLRLKAEIPETKKGFKGLNLFDTPGFNAIISEHTEVLKSFLPECDAVVFPVVYKVGVGESDQKLMELIGDVRQQFGRFPVILVVNRVPDGLDEKDKRIKEIRLNAEDTLHEKIKLVLVRSSALDSFGASTMPDTDHLWREVYSVIDTPEHRKEMEEHFRAAFLSLVERRINEINGKISAANVGRAEIAQLEKQKKDIADSQKKAFAVIDRYVEQITHDLPKLVARGAKELNRRIANETDAANKWNGASSCQAYIYGHVLPFGTLDITKDMETYLCDINGKMDEELNEMTNLAVRHFESEAHTVKNPEFGKLLLNIGTRIATRLGRDGAKNFVASSLGGVGGVASGFGNLAKMTVSKTGKLFGKTFSRQIYNNIGKIFTKRFVQTMGVVLQVAVDVASFIAESNRWQGKLKNAAEETVSKWETEVQGEVKNSMIPEFVETNRKSVKECYAAMQDEIDHSISDMARNYNLETLSAFNDDLEKLRKLSVALKG